MKGVDDWSHSLDQDNKNHHYHFVPVVCGGDKSIYFHPDAGIFMAGSIQAEKKLFAPDEALIGIGLVLQNPITKSDRA